MLIKINRTFTIKEVFIAMSFGFAFGFLIGWIAYFVHLHLDYFFL